MAARALTAAAIAGRRVAVGRTGPHLLASCRSGAKNHSTSAQRQEDHSDVVHGPAAAMTGAQVEAALNCKNVEVLQGEEHVASVLPDEAIELDGGAGSGEDASWVPDQKTGVFGPADADTAATHGSPGAAVAAAMPTEGGSVLDQEVFVREEEMEDAERPAIDMANGSANN